MIKISDYTKAKIKEGLLTKQSQIVLRLASISQEDSFLKEAVPESSELGTDAWFSEVNATREALKQELSRLAQQIQLALLRMDRGMFGACERCPGEIEEARLQILPTATLCINCK